MATKKSIKELPVVEIEASAATQTRYRIDPTTVEEYAAAYRNGQILPELTVFAEKGSKRYLLADGFHRLAAAKRVGHETVACQIQRGGVREALQHALGANDEHGLRRSNKDKRNAVTLALKDPEWLSWSNAMIGRLCRVDDKTVAKVREDLVVAGEIEEQDTVKETVAGKVRERKSKKGSSEIRTARKSNKKQEDSGKKRRTQPEVNRDDCIAGAKAVLSYPDSGASLAGFDAFSNRDVFERLRQFCTEYIDACDLDK